MTGTARYRRAVHCYWKKGSEDRLCALLPRRDRVF